MAEGGRNGVFVVGALHLDVVVRAPRMPTSDETLFGSRVDYVSGGKGRNQAASAAQHGAPTAMAGRVGEDQFGYRLLADLDNAGVDTGQIRRVPGASGMSVAILDARGEYGAVIVSNVNMSVDPQEIELPATAGILLLQNELPEAVNVEVARKARAAGIPVMLNAAPTRPTGNELWSLVDFVVVNIVELEMLAGQPVRSDGEVLAAVAAVAGLGPDVIATLGARGVTCKLGDTWIQDRGYKVDVNSTHGAGDMFVGALAARVAAGDDPQDVVRYAQVSAALFVSSPIGERAKIDEAAVRAFIAERA